MSETDLLEQLAIASAHPSNVEFLTAKPRVASSFAEIWRFATRAAAALSKWPKDEPLAGFISPSPYAIACAVGCLRAGVDFVSLPLPGRGQGSADYLAQITHVMQLAGARRIVMERDYLVMIGGLAPAVQPMAMAAEELVERGADSSRGDPLPGRLIQFSSGTTGVPKGIVLTTGNIGASVAATIEALDVQEGDASCQWVPLSHDMGLIGGLFTAWAGAQRRYLGTSPGNYVCMSPDRFIARPMAWLENCAATRATITAAPTFAYQVVARHLRTGPKLDLSRLRVMLVGAEQISADVLRAFVDAAAPHGLDERALCPAYGLAEATLAVSLVRPSESWSSVRLTVDGETRDYVSCGRALSCIELRAPDTVPGPINVRGAAVSKEYLPSREIRQDGWLDTKDLGLLVGNELVVTGRSDDMLCLAGRNLYAWELEQQAGATEGVRAGNCAVVPDAEGRYILLFEAVGAEQERANALLLELRRRLAAYAGIGPSTVACVARGILPKTPSGKLQRNKIRAGVRTFVDQSVAQMRF